MKGVTGKPYGIVSLILGISSLFFSLIPIIGWLFIIATFVVGIIALKKGGGRGFAIAGLVLGVISLFFAIVVTYALIVTLRGASIDVLEGAVLAKKKFPQPAPVMYVSKTGDELTLEEAFPGFVYLYVDRKTAKATVESAVAAQGGSIAGAIPYAGIYLIEVAQGKESAFLSAMFRESWVLEGIPAMPLVPGSVTLYDYFSFKKSDKMSCHWDHGDLARMQAARLGSDTQAVDLPTQVPNENDYVDHIDIAVDMLNKMKAASKSGQNVVFSMSLQPKTSGKAINGSGCKEKACVAARLGQKAFHQQFLQMLDAQIAVDPKVAEHAAVVMIAGNAGVDLDVELTNLQKRFPRAFEHVKIVGGARGFGRIDTHLNHLRDNSVQNMVYSLGDDVEISPPDDITKTVATCSGTSFAGPEVAAVLDYIWSRNPALKATQVIDAFDKALAELGVNNTLLQNTRGHTAPAFLERAVEFAEGVKPAPAPVPSPASKARAQELTFTVMERLPLGLVGKMYEPISFCDFVYSSVEDRTCDPAFAGYAPGDASDKNPSGGSPPYTFTASGLPTGLSLKPNGFLEGTIAKETTPNDYAVNVCVNDAAWKSACKTTTLPVVFVGIKLDKISCRITGEYRDSDYFDYELEASGTVSGHPLMKDTILIVPTSAWRPDEISFECPGWTANLVSDAVSKCVRGDGPVTTAWHYRVTGGAPRKLVNEIKLELGSYHQDDNSLDWVYEKFSGEC